MENNNIGFLFDLDGVLIDSEKEYSRIWRTVNQIYPSGTESIESVIKGCTLDKILDDYYPDSVIRELVIKKLYELEQQMRYEMLPGAAQMLGALKTKGIPSALVTSSNDVKMKHLDEELPELRNSFDFIVTADLISASKPDPEGYLLAAGKLGVNPVKCVVFEDSLQGVKAGRNAGAFVIGMAGTLPAETIAPYCDLVVDSMTQIELDSLIQTLKERK